MIRFLTAASLCLLLSGCLLPEPPKKKSFVSVEETSLFTVYTMDRDHKSAPAPAPGVQPRKMLPTSKNLIFITADNFTNKQFEPMLEAAYKKDPAPSLNDVTWWQFVPLFRDEYYKVAYLPFEQAKYANIMAAIKYMEKQSLKYDLIIMSHGIPNHLTTGETGYFLSFKEIGELKGQLKKLNLVFMQACFGQSLAVDWVDAGAKTVIAFEGFNRNFFFISVFLDHHRWYDDDGAFYTANRDMRKELDGKKLYKYLISKGLGMSVDEYLAQTEKPILSNRRNVKRASIAPSAADVAAASTPLSAVAPIHFDPDLLAGVEVAPVEAEPSAPQAPAATAF